MRVDRRHFLKTATVATMLTSTRLRALTSISSLLAPDAPSGPVVLDHGFGKVVKLVDGVYVTLADETKGDQCSSNGGVLVGKDAVLVVEGHMRPAGAALELEAAGMISDRPVRGAVNTHFHLDHTFGNSTYADRKVPIIAHEKTAGLMKLQYAAIQGKDKSPLLRPHQQLLAAATGDPDKTRKKQDLEMWQWMYGEIDAARLAYPTESVSASSPMKIDLGGLTAILEPFAGHTPADVVVRVPERDVVFTGDLLFNQSYPVALDADMSAWRKVLDRFARYERRTRFIPGHNAICGIDNVRSQCDLFDSLHSHAVKMLAAGVSIQEAERRYELPKPFAAYQVYWGFSIGAAMKNYYESARRRIQQ
jgi:glyoxylase-like metal-dependent hydrolase (beta-lactamase superfamily II)